MGMHQSDAKKHIKEEAPSSTAGSNTLFHTVGYLAAVALPFGVFTLKTMIFPSDAAKDQARKAEYYDAIKACVEYKVTKRPLSIIQNGNDLTKVQGTSGKFDTTGAILNLNSLNPEILKDLYTPQPTKIVKDGGTPFDRWGITLSK